MAEYSRGLSVPKALGVQISQALNLQRVVDHAADPPQVGNRERPASELLQTDLPIARTPRQIVIDARNGTAAARMICVTRITR